MTLPLFQLQYLLSKLDSRSHSIHSWIYSREEAECVLANLDYEKYYFAVSADAPLIIRATPYSERVGDEVVGTMGFCAWTQNYSTG